MNRNKFLKLLVGLPFVTSLLSFTKKNTEKVIFTPEMLSRNNFGLFIINSKVTDVTKNPGYAATVSWKLAWTLQVCVNPAFKGHPKQVYEFPKYGKINFLTDGWYSAIGNTYEDVCEYLNNNPYGVSFRLMTKEEVIFLISNSKQGFL